MFGFSLALLIFLGFLWLLYALAGWIGVLIGIIIYLLYAIHLHILEDMKHGL